MSSVYNLFFVVVIRLQSFSRNEVFTKRSLRKGSGAIGKWVLEIRDCRRKSEVVIKPKWEKACDIPSALSDKKKKTDPHDKCNCH